MKAATAQHVKKNTSFIIALLISVVVAVPFLWMVSCSLQPSMSGIFDWPPRLIPPQPRLMNYVDAFLKINIPLLLKNTMILVVCTVTLQVTASIFVAYGFARFRAPGSSFLFYVLLATMMLPWVVTMVPAYIIFLKVGWVGTFLPLIAPSIGGNAFFVFMMRQFLMGIPRDLDEAAKIDGCSNMGILFKVLLPNCGPIIATMVIFAFNSTWSDFIGPSIYLTRPSMQTLSIGLQYFTSSMGATPWQLVMAASTIFAIPMIIVFFAFQNAFTKGIVTTGLKG